MNQLNFDQFNQQIEKNLLTPTRDLTVMALDHFEKLAEVQFEAGKAYTDMGVQQLRALLNVRDQKGVQDYVESQQKLAQSVTDRLKGDAEKVVALNQEFTEKAQKAVQQNVTNATKAAQKATSSQKAS
ncbi:hypothetical protein KBTX_02213 [wastewater metagenome]|uniref:Phasin domain-containing protein n=2 Tax=unclassified sequences TaxID=12908 RepID=A0A5B8RGA8_9ZZZZ|nr:MULTISPECIES: phasin family protein [Arhodomonas]MCS4505461.1 phasin family protein [Arhodomonas aquaeolei]QEA05885.1 hypothetical protein KBTEX_02213 [uncultured organism]